MCESAALILLFLDDFLVPLLELLDVFRVELRVGPLELEPEGPHIHDVLGEL